VLISIPVSLKSLGEHCRSIPQFRANNEVKNGVAQQKYFGHVIFLLSSSSPPT
jgi:hypothetical protein